MKHWFILEKEGTLSGNWVPIYSGPSLRKVYEVKRTCYPGMNRVTGELCKFRILKATNIENISEV